MAGGIVEKIGKVARWGNSLGFRIPQESVDRLELKEGETVNVRVKGDTINICRGQSAKNGPRRNFLKASHRRCVGLI